MQINIVTHDKDLYQLISDNVSIYSAAKKELLIEMVALKNTEFILSR